jgi:hypothetical protein
MELFLPGLIVLLIAGLFAFFVIPRIGSTILIVICLIALIAAGIHHYTFFAGEYALTTWQYGLAAYAPWVVLALALVFVLAAISFFFSSPETKATVLNAVSTPMAAVQEAAAEATANMPSAATATNPFTAAVNTALKNAGNLGAAAAGAAAGAAPSSNTNGSSAAGAGGNQNKKNNRPNQKGSPLIPGLPFSAGEV